MKWVIAFALVATVCVSAHTTKATLLSKCGRVIFFFFFFFSFNNTTLSTRFSIRRSGMNERPRVLKHRFSFTQKNEKQEKKKNKKKKKKSGFAQLTYLFVLFCV
jgi:hypothetical protein